LADFLAAATISANPDIQRRQLFRTKVLNFGTPSRRIIILLHVVGLHDCPGDKTVLKLLVINARRCVAKE